VVGRNPDGLAGPGRLREAVFDTAVVQGERRESQPPRPPEAHGIAGDAFVAGNLALVPPGSGRQDHARPEGHVLRRAMAPYELLQGLAFCL
jgi:hypothetical protein